jgi:hypothetical protein
MPIYLVRWPDLSASLVRAPSEEHLLDILDQTANPEGCEWEEYDGPLAIDFRLPAEWHIRDERAGDLSRRTSSSSTTSGRWLGSTSPGR